MRMPSKSSRPLLLPGAEFAKRAVPVTRQPARTWYKIHWESRSALEFTLNPGHRFSHAASPYPVLYIGPTIQTCLWEVFGDDVFQGKRTIAKSRWEGRSLSEVVVPAIKVCAVSTEKTRSVMAVEKGSLLAADLDIPQAWGLAIQQHPAGFEAIKYTSRFVDQPCLALFGHPGLQPKLREKKLGALSDLDEAVNWLHEQDAALV